VRDALSRQSSRDGLIKTPQINRSLLVQYLYQLSGSPVLRLVLFPRPKFFCQQSALT
jgi:hypothetical protein